MDTAIKEDLRATELAAELDNSCKRLLAHKSILAWIMKTCLQEYADVPVQEIADRYIEGSPQVGDIGVMPEQSHTSTDKISGISNEDASGQEGVVRYDIRFRATAPNTDPEGGLIELIINVEAQNKFHNSYRLPRRAIYYLSRMVSAQYGTEFSHSHYENIKKVYSIWICTHPPKARQETITKLHMVAEPFVGEVIEDPRDYDLMTAVMIYLGEPKADHREGGEKKIFPLLENLLSNTVDANTKMEVMEKEYAIPMTDELEREVERMCNISAGIMEESFNRGIDVGMNKGIDIGVLKTIQSFLDNSKLTFEEIVAIMHLSAEEQEKYKKQLHFH